MPVHPQIRILLDQFAEAAAAPLWEIPVEQGRELYRAMSQLASPSDVPIGKVESAEFEGPGGEVKARIYTPVAAGGSSLPGFVFFHGGGFVLGDLDTADPLCRALANESGCRIVSVDYRLAPENRFPAAVEDAHAAVRWVDQRANDLGIDANRVAVGGNSAGGNLAAVVCQLARKGGPSLAFQMLVCPVTEMQAETDSITRFAEGYLLERRMMDWFFSQYAPDGDKTDPRLSPLLAEDLSGLPPAYIVTAGYDPLHDEGAAYAERLKTAGVDVTLMDYPSMIHDFLLMAGASSVARDAVAAAGRALKEALR